MLSFTISDIRTVHVEVVLVDIRKSSMPLIGSKNVSVIGGSSRLGRCFGRDEWGVSSILRSNNSESATIAASRRSTIGVDTGFLSFPSP